MYNKDTLKTGTARRLYRPTALTMQKHKFIGELNLIAQVLEPCCERSRKRLQFICFNDGVSVTQFV